MDDIGVAIKLLRIKKGLSQGELSELTGNSDSYISLLERGKRGIHLDMLKKIAIALEKPMFLICFLAESDNDQIPQELKEKLMYEAMK